MKAAQPPSLCRIPMLFLGKPRDSNKNIEYLPSSRQPVLSRLRLVKKHSRLVHSSSTSWLFDELFPLGCPDGYTERQIQRSGRFRYGSRPSPLASRKLPCAPETLLNMRFSRHSAPSIRSSPLGVSQRIVCRSISEVNDEKKISGA